MRILSNLKSKNCKKKSFKIKNCELNYIALIVIMKMYKNRKAFQCIITLYINNVGKLENLLN
jgi:hypothetical protein